MQHDADSSHASSDHDVSAEQGLPRLTPRAEQRLSNLPAVYRDSAFWGMSATQFLGAFNDNLFRQMMLLLAIPVGAAAAEAQDQQGVAMVVFSLPFVLFSGYAGFLSDRYSKRTIILLSKLGEIGVMLLGVLAFLMHTVVGYQGLLVVLFLMGTQSAFFGPGKYGILPEMFRERDLPRVNGFILMTTFLAIIFGQASAGGLGELLTGPDETMREAAGRMWIGVLGCIAIAVVGTVTALWVRRVPAARPKLRFRWSALSIPPESRRVLRRDRPLLAALLATCMFWLMSGLAIQSVNSLGMTQLDVGPGRTSIMTAVIGVGIAIGAVIAGRLSRGRADFRVMRIGAWSLFGWMLLMSVSLPDGRHLLGFQLSLPVLIVLGASAGFFAIPLQVFIQARPPAGLKGRIIALMNQANFVAILFAGVLYLAFDRLIEAQGWPRSSLFALMAAVILPVAVFYRPKNEAGQRLSPPPGRG